MSTVEMFVQSSGYDVMIEFLENPINLAIAFGGTAAIIAAVGFALSSFVTASRAHGTSSTR